MDLIEIAGLRKTKPRTNGFSEHNEERTISYGSFSFHTGNDLLETAEPTVDECTQTQNNQRYFMSGMDQDSLVTENILTPSFLL